jgi:hypothetical protein
MAKLGIHLPGLFLGRLSGQAQAMLPVPAIMLPFQTSARESQCLWKTNPTSLI